MFFSSYTVVRLVNFLLLNELIKPVYHRKNINIDYRSRLGWPLQNVEVQFHMKVKMHRKIVPYYKQKCVRASI